MKILKNAENIFMGTAIIVSTIVLFVNIILRYFFAANTTWAEEFIRYVMIWITFIGSSLCFRRGVHFGVDLLMHSLAATGKRIIQLYINIASLIFMVLLIKFGLDLVLFSIDTGQTTPSLGIKIYWVYLAIPLGAFLSIIHISTQTCQLIKNKEKSTE